MNEVLKMVEDACNAAQIDVTSVSFDLKGKTAGDFAWKEYHIRINPFVIENYPNELQNLVIHEVAHAADYKRHGHRKNSRGQYAAHDTIFRNIMNEIASSLSIVVDTTTTHTMKLPAARKQRRWQYTCGCEGNIDVSTVIHNRIQKKGQRRICRNCRETFGKQHFVGEFK